MIKENGLNSKSKKVLLIVAISFIVFIFVMNSDKILGLLGGSLASSNSETMISEALAYYYDKVGNEGTSEVEAVKKNFGCHFEIYIYNNGELDMRLTYSGGKFYEL